MVCSWALPVLGAVLCTGGGFAQAKPSFSPSVQKDFFESFPGFPRFHGILFSLTAESLLSYGISASR